MFGSLLTIGKKGKNEKELNSHIVRRLFKSRRANNDIQSFSTKAVAEGFPEVGRKLPWVSRSCQSPLRRGSREPSLPPPWWDNVILIISDTLRRDALSCYGGSWIHTPHLDRFAEQAVIFDNAYISSFPTVPLRNDVLTGRYTFTYKPWSPLDDDAVTLQETLSKAGILTSLVVDTPHPFRSYNYQRGFAAWQVIRGQENDSYRSAPRKVKLPCAAHKLRSPDVTMVKYLRNVARRQREEDYFVAQNHGHRRPVVGGEPRRAPLLSLRGHFRPPRALGPAPLLRRPL